MFGSVRERFGTVNCMISDIYCSYGFLRVLNVNLFLFCRLKCLSILQLIDGGKVNVQDVALEISISPDSLTETISVIHHR